MKLKPLIVTVIILAALSAAAHFLTRLPIPPSAADPRVGQAIVDRATLEQAAQLRLTGNSLTVLLARQPDASWRVASYHDLPADFDKLSRFVDKLTNAKVQRFVTANPDRLARLEFGGQQFALLDAAGHELWSLTLGKNAEAGGCFIHFGDEQKAYLASLDPWFDPVAKDWADTSLLNLKPADIARVEIGFEAAPAVVASRAKTGDPLTAATAPAGQQLAADKIDSLLDQLIKLRFSDTSDPADPGAIAAKQHARTFKLITFDGKTYTLALGRKPEEKITKPAGAVHAPISPNSDLKSQIDALVKQASATKTETIPAGPVYAFIACSEASAPVNALMQKRAFQIDDKNYTGLPEKPGDLFVPAPAAKP